MLNVILVNAIMQNVVIMLKIVMLNAITQNVVVLNVAAPTNQSIKLNDRALIHLTGQFMAVSIIPKMTLFSINIFCKYFSRIQH